MKMQVQKIQNNNSYNQYFMAKPINIDIKLKMSDLANHLQKKVPDSELKTVDLNGMFEKANQNKKNDEKAAILTGNEIYEFFEIAWRKLSETSMDIYSEMQSFVYAKREEMWKSVERDFTPEEKERMKNLINIQKKASNDMTKYSRKITSLRQDESGKVTQEQINKAEEELSNASKQYRDTTDEIKSLKYDKSKLDTTKYIDLDA